MFRSEFYFVLTYCDSSKFFFLSFFFYSLYPYFCIYWNSCGVWVLVLQSSRNQVWLWSRHRYREVCTSHGWSKYNIPLHSHCSQYKVIQTGDKKRYQHQVTFLRNILPTNSWFSQKIESQHECSTHSWFVITIPWHTFCKYT